MRSLFPGMDQNTSLNSQMKLMGPESNHPDPHHPYPIKACPQHDVLRSNGPQFDSITCHSTFQHMPSPENWSTYYSFQGLPRGLLLSFPMNRMPDRITEMNKMHGLQLSLPPPTLGSYGTVIPGSLIGNNGSNNPPALNRLIEMELIASAHNPGLYSLELYTTFWCR
ncbi:uncharacterized protein LOC120261057 [Dioscorea cayenensis subsp. rotundata]|uniref:Uncharacterized protein LOC120261057 n=1 Tax=Dioscorea cayennensis subsp. rotundata TaxID=55577 RepID=A0AB40BBZ3_DIOCR|nr:uncharacterized protein LOC120261057 [Dioscorea cayenensis subsp. rotundata]